MKLYIFTGYKEGLLFDVPSESIGALMACKKGTLNDAGEFEEDIGGTHLDFRTIVPANPAEALSLMKSKLDELTKDRDRYQRDYWAEQSKHSDTKKEATLLKTLVKGDAPAVEKKEVVDEL
jgi:hypothetical protein